MNRTINKKLRELFDGELTLKEFYTWQVVYGWNREDSDLSRISLLFAEYTSHHRTKENLLDELRKLWLSASSAKKK